MPPCKCLSVSISTLFLQFRRRTEVQCFPFYSIMLAIGNPRVDLFSLDVEGAEMGILKTIPWDKVEIRLNSALIL